MFIENTVAFGNFVPGDRVLIPDGAEFDHSYFKAVADNPPDDKPVDPPKPVDKPDEEPSVEVDITVDVEPEPENN